MCDLDRRICRGLLKAVFYSTWSPSMQTAAHTLMFILLFLLSTVGKSKDISLVGDYLFWLVQRAALRGVILHYVPSGRAGGEF